MEEVEIIIESAEEQMANSIQHLEKQLLKIRAGRANPSMLEGVKLDYYGTLTPLTQVGNVSTPDARTLTVQPWEKGLIQEIEKAIMNANLGLNPQNNGDMVIINIPPLTEERRKDLVRKSRQEAEDARIGIRNARKEANDEIKKLDGLSEDSVKDAENRIQDVTNSHVKKVDVVIEKKEVEVMQV